MDTTTANSTTGLLEGFFADSLRDFCIRETYTTDAGFRAWVKTLDHLRAMDADDMEYVINNRTFRQIVEGAHGGIFARE
jgi:hypothetical protein